MTLFRATLLGVFFQPKETLLTEALTQFNISRDDKMHCHPQRGQLFMLLYRTWQTLLKYILYGLNTRKCKQCTDYAMCDFVRTHIIKSCGDIAHVRATLLRDSKNYCPLTLLQASLTEGHHGSR